jgi:hypothetical protein
MGSGWSAQSVLVVIALTGRSKIYFPLRSNASALYAGPGVAGVRRRILAAALLHDHVILEDGLHVSWAGPTGASNMTARGPVPRWQTAPARGRATGTRHYFAVSTPGAPEGAPLHPIVSTDATFSWRATFEPFRGEVPRSASSWLDFGHVDDETTAKAAVRDWKSADRLEDYRTYRLASRPEPPGGQRVFDALLDAGYFDLATAAQTGAAISIDRRHGMAVRRRLEAGDAHRVAGHYATEIMLPADFTWDDVPGLRKHRALASYRALIREIEDAALTDADTTDLAERIEREYRVRLRRAAERGIPFGGRATLAGIGFVVGSVASAAPLIGGAAALGMFAAGEVLARAAQPRWLTIDRRLNGPRNGL